MSHDPERRAYERRAIVVDVSAWSLVQPTLLLAGTTVELAGGGALLQLPGLSEAAVSLELLLALPGQPLVARGRIVSRQPPDLYAVSFEHIDPSQRERLLEFIRAAA
jgi:hypothetical protein